MSEDKNAPLTLELQGWVVDRLAEWARMDGHVMRLDVTSSEFDKAVVKRDDRAQNLLQLLIHNLPALPAGSDLAAAVKERDDGYAAYRLEQRESVRPTPP
jgi:hypothetical protein